MAPGRPNRRSPLTLDAIDVFIAAETNKTGRPLSRYRDLIMGDVSIISVEKQNKKKTSDATYKIGPVSAPDDGGCGASCSHPLRRESLAR